MGATSRDNLAQTVAETYANRREGREALNILRECSSRVTVFEEETA